MKRTLATELLNWMGIFFFISVIVLQMIGYEQPVQSVAGQQDTLMASAHTGAPVIVLDAGHGGSDGGAVGTESGVVESGINLAVTKMVEARLKHHGVSVIMTRTDEKALGSTKQNDMKKRREIMRTEGVAAVISIHMNKFGDRSIHGPMVFYMKGSEQGEALATKLVCAVCDAVGYPQRMANPGDYYVVRESIAPAAIVECGFLSNAEDERKLQEHDYQTRLADGITAGILSYLEAAG